MNPIRILHVWIFSFRLYSQYWNGHFSWSYCVNNHKHLVVHKRLSDLLYLVSIWVESSFTKLNIVSSWNILFESDPLLLLWVKFSCFLRIVEEILSTSFWNLCLSMLLVFLKILFNDHKLLVLKVFRNDVPILSSSFQKMLFHKVVDVWKSKCFEHFRHDLIDLCIKPIAFIAYNVKMRMTTPCSLKVFVNKFGNVQVLLISCFVFQCVVFIGSVSSSHHVEYSVISFLSHLDFI